MALVATKYPSLKILSHNQEHHGPLLPGLVKICQHMSSIRVIFLRRFLKKQEISRGGGGWVRKDWRNYIALRLKKKSNEGYVDVFKFG